MSKTDEIETKVAIVDGFFGARRVRAGETFRAARSEKAKWFKSADPEDVTDDLGGEPNLLDNSIPDIVAGLAGLSDKQLDGLLSAEQAGKTRKGVLAAIEDERANRIGRLGGNDPKAKQPEETDPKQPNAKADELLD